MLRGGKGVCRTGNLMAAVREQRAGVCGEGVQQAGKAIGALGEEREDREGGHGGSYRDEGDRREQGDEGDALKSAGGGKGGKKLGVHLVVRSTGRRGHAAYRATALIDSSTRRGLAGGHRR